jgi:hypothetical protein
MYTITPVKPVASAISADERVLTIRAARGTKDNPTQEKPRYCLVQKHSDNWLSLLKPEVVRELVEAAEDKYLLGLIRASGSIPSGKQSREAFEEWFLASQISSRLSKEAIEAWFTADIWPVLSAALRDKGFSSDKIEPISKAYMGQFMSLAGRSVSMEQKVKDQLVKCLALLPEDYEDLSGVAEKVAAKLNEAAPAENVLDAL